ncbi:MAG: hypothetical protein AAGC71_13595 [Pseudomonadota bacterium]
MRTLLLVTLASYVAAGCAGFDASAVRELTAAERTVLEQSRMRLSDNRQSVNDSLSDLAETVAYVLPQRDRVAANLAKAKLLESMKSPWAATAQTTTQREVALYHLFALSDAENAVLQQEIATRTARIDALRGTYAGLIRTLSALLAAQEQLLTHLSQPTSTQIMQVVNQVLIESQALRAALDTDNNPRLQRLYDGLVEREQALANAQERILMLIERIENEE